MFYSAPPRLRGKNEMFFHPVLFAKSELFAVIQICSCGFGTNSYAASG